MTKLRKEAVQVATRFCKKHKKRFEIKKPNIISIYNKSMARIDRMDQNIVK